MKKFPIGIQTFSELINNGYYYVDKSKFVYLLNSTGKYFFLSRPRRFGKSLFLSTLEAAYSCQKKLFEGLFLENNWNWNESFPIISISFGSGICRSMVELQETFSDLLIRYSKDHNFIYTSSNLKGKFEELIRTVSQKYNQKVVVLIDEYDKPILDNILKKNIARSIREELKNYYSILKDCDRYLKLVFITGVSKFSKVSLFSGLNNLEDISLSEDFSTIAGYTQQELEIVFKESLKDLNLEQIKLWYNGYRFNGNGVYNPFDILLYLKNRDFRNYWFESATPTFLIDLLKKKHYYIPTLENIEAGEEILSSFDIDDIDINTLLYQTGYLTIHSIFKRETTPFYRLGWPNLEVKKSLTDSILKALTKKSTLRYQEMGKLYDAIKVLELDSVQELFHSFFASIPHDWYRKNQLSDYEGYYASIFYTYFTAIGLLVIAEDCTNHGKIDLTVVMDHAVFIFEFKVINKSIQNQQEIERQSYTKITDLPTPALPTQCNALMQLYTKKYFEKYTSLHLPIYLIGIEFEPSERNITCFQWEKLNKR